MFIFSLWQFDEKSSHTDKPSNLFYLSFVIVLLLTVFFRFYLLNKVPGEMFSDHAEKLLDVMDILEGKFPIFFVRNTGREALQFYVTAAIIKIFKTGISFTSLKLGTAFFGFLALPFIYLLGKQLFNKWIGLIGFSIRRDRILAECHLPGRSQIPALSTIYRHSTCIFFSRD